MIITLNFNSYRVLLTLFICVSFYNDILTFCYACQIDVYRYCAMLFTSGDCRPSSVNIHKSKE